MGPCLAPLRPDSHAGLAAHAARSRAVSRCPLCCRPPRIQGLRPRGPRKRGAQDAVVLSLQSGRPRGRRAEVLPGPGLREPGTESSAPGCAPGPALLPRRPQGPVSLLAAPACLPCSSLKPGSCGSSASSSTSATCLNGWNVDSKVYFYKFIVSVAKLSCAEYGPAVTLPRREGTL